ncbi:hypothetical protein LguiA_010180 [Lonicera macranthoides]
MGPTSCSYFTPPPPPLAIVDTITPPQVVYSNNGEKQQQQDSSSSSSTSSIIIVIIIIASAIIVSASIYLLLRLISRRFHRSLRTSSAVDDVVTAVNRDSHSHDRREPPPGDLFNSLPLFTEYVDRFASSISVSSRALSFRSSGGFFTGSSRRSDPVVVEDIEANRIGEEIGELFRWISGV